MGSQVGSFGSIPWFGSPPPPVIILDAIEWNREKYPVALSGYDRDTYDVDWGKSSYFPQTGETAYYVDVARPSNSGDGLSWATAKKSIQNAITAANAAGVPAVIYVRAGTYPREDGFTGAGGTVRSTVDTRFVAVDGRVVVWHGSNITDWTAGPSGTWVGSRAGVCGAIDPSRRDVLGNHPRFRRLANRAAVEASSGQDVYAQDGAFVVVKRADGSAISNSNVRCFIQNLGSAFRIGSVANGKKISVEGFEFQGGSSDTVLVETAVRDVVVYFKEVISGYGGCDINAASMNGFGVNGGGLVVFERCQARGTTSDGFNFHWTPDASRSQFIISVDCVGRGHGVAEYGLSNNGYTAHETCVGIDIRGDYGYGRDGGTIANIGTTLWAMLGTIAGPQAPGPVTAVSFRTADSAKLYLVDADARIAGEQKLSLAPADTSEIHVLRVGLGGGSIGGSGQVIPMVSVSLS